MSAPGLSGNGFIGSAKIDALLPAIS